MSEVREFLCYPQIKVSPDQVTEGDHMTITCDTKLSPHRETTELQFVFYRNGHNVQGFSLSNQYGVPSAQLEDSGNYTCEVQTPTGSVRKRSNAAHIQIQELFTATEIKVTPDQVTEGDHMNITCDTKLSPHRETTKLQFVFYRNGHNVQGFSLSNQYGVPSAQLEDSGNYTCEVQTPTGSVRKRSNVSYIQIQELFYYPQIKVSPDQVTEGDHMTITCDTKLSPHRETTELQFVFYRNGHNVQGFSLSNQYGVPSAQLEDSGNYSCAAQTPTSSVRKRSSMTHIWIQELISYSQIKVSPDQVTEGDHMTITCDTKLSPHRETTELQFVFYRNGHNVQGFSLSNQYGVPSAQLEDSGNYTCEVQTPTGSVRKRSREAHIEIQGGYLSYLVPSLTGILAVSLLITVIIAFKFRHKPKTDENSPKASVRTGIEEEIHSPAMLYEDIADLANIGSHMEEDICYASIYFSHTQKDSSLPMNKTDKHSVTYATVKWGNSKREKLKTPNQEISNTSCIYGDISSK
ncbi:Fc receptor-like protein 2 [Xenopus laevis]|uniref:Fc receptor-like protein 2 n=1 Tax=Xenopus laevis TaxID=8355 RepID=A0A8J1LMH1_XENLA|nr:Fc receptor-like protein 2 [Xenopus laevis]